MRVRVGGIVLSGGTGRRLGGVDKGALELGGLTLLARAVATMAEIADSVVVVGPETQADRSVSFVREDPPFGGPAAGLLAGASWLAGRHFERAAFVAVDMPFVDAATFARLGENCATTESDGAVLVGTDGRAAVCGVVDVTALLAAAPSDPSGLPLRKLFERLDLARVAAIGREVSDIDSWRDLADVADSAE